MTTFGTLYLVFNSFTNRFELVSEEVYLDSKGTLKSINNPYTNTPIKGVSKLKLLDFISALRKQSISQKELFETPHKLYTVIKTVLDSETNN